MFINYAIFVLFFNLYHIYNSGGIQMIIIKYISLGMVLAISFSIGYLISKKYSSRVNELKEMQIALDILENKIKYTYEPLKDIFAEMKKLLKGNISELFSNISKKLESNSVETAFSESLKEVKTNLLSEDLEVINNLSKTLGKTEKDGQVSQIELSKTFINSQIKKAEKEEEKNSKLYKTLGITVGLAVIILLI